MRYCTWAYLPSTLSRLKADLKPTQSRPEFTNVCPANAGAVKSVVALN